MDKKIFGVYLAAMGGPKKDIYATLELPASPWELWDAVEKLQVQDGEELYLEIDDYYCFEQLAPHLAGMDVSLMELNDLAGRLARLNEVQQIAFEGLLQRSAGDLTMKDLRVLASSTDCCHVIAAADDAQLGRFYAENDFIPEVEDIPDKAFELLDFAKIGRMMRLSEHGVFTPSGYVVQHSDSTQTIPVLAPLPQKPDYLFRLTLRLYSDMGISRTAVLELPVSEEGLTVVQEQLGTPQWENTVVLDYDGVLPNAACFADLPMELAAFNDLAAMVRDMPSLEKNLPKLNALLEHFEVKDIETAMLLTEHLEDYILEPEIRSAQEMAVRQLHSIMDEHSAELLFPHVNLFAYGRDIIWENNADLTSYGLLHRADYQPMMMPVQQSQEMEIK